MVEPLGQNTIDRIAAGLHRLEDRTDCMFTLPRGSRELYESAIRAVRALDKQLHAVQKQVDAQLTRLADERCPIHGIGLGQHNEVGLLKCHRSDCEFSIWEDQLQDVKREWSRITRRNAGT